MSRATSDPPRRRAVFLDRDGVLNREVEYLHRVDDFEWIPGAPEALRRLREAGFLTIVVTNQAGVAHGYYDEAAIDTLHRHMQRELACHGARIDAFYYSPYHPAGAVEAYRRPSGCRKPGTGMFERALGEWNIDPAASFMIGDKNSDVEPARALGMVTFLVQTGYGREMAATTRADHVVADVGAAATQILALCSTTP